MVCCYNWQARTVDHVVLQASEYFESTLRELRTRSVDVVVPPSQSCSLIKYTAPKKGKEVAKVAFPCFCRSHAQPPPTKAVLFVSQTYPPWQATILTYLNTVYDPSTKTLPDVKVLQAHFKVVLVKSSDGLTYTDCGVAEAVHCEGHAICRVCGSRLLSI